MDVLFSFNWPPRGPFSEAIDLRRLKKLTSCCRFTAKTRVLIETNMSIFR